jgi:hypothetical protein
MKVATFLFLLLVSGSAEAGETASYRNNVYRPNFSSIPSPAIRVQNQCGPANCCLNDACRRRYNSEWKPDLGRCGACAVQ